MASAPVAAFLAQPGLTRDGLVTEDFTNGSVRTPGALLENSGFVANEMGWTLPPGHSGRLVYHIHKEPGRTLVVSVWMYAGAYGVTGEIAARAGQDPFQTVVVNPSASDALLSLPPAAEPASDVDLEFRAANASPQTRLVVDQLTWAYGSGEPARPAPRWALVAPGLLGGLAFLAFCRWRRDAIGISAGIALLLAVATYSRGLELSLTANATLDPDAYAYRAYADRFQYWPLWDRGLFSASFSEREPLYPMVAHTFFTLVGSSDFHLRALSTILSVAVVVLSVAAARRRLSWLGSLAVGLVVSLNLPLIEESSRGLRTEPEMCLLLVLYLTLDRGTSKRPLLNASLTSLAGAGLVLTRSFYMPAVLVATVVAYLSRYRVRRALALSAVVLAVVVAAQGAHRLALYERTGDAFYDTSLYARWLANVELYTNHYPLRHPELFPTYDEYVTNGPYYGPHLSTFQYFFVVHTPQEVALDSLRGYADVFWGTDGLYLPAGGPLKPLAAQVLAVRQAGDQVIRWLALAGLVALTVTFRRQPRNLILPVLVAGSLSYAVFTYHRGLIDHYRLTMEVYPLGLIAGGWLVEAAVRLGRARLQPKP